MEFVNLSTSGVLDGALVGEGAALLAAFLWAMASLMFGRMGRQLSPLVLNLVKGAFALALLLLTILIQLGGEPVPSLPWVSVVLLGLSGGLGIGLGDMAYFSAINALGARKALLLETLAPPMSTVLAWIFLSERLPLNAIAGILITLLGIAWVISERVPGDPVPATRAGLQISLLATACQAIGAVLSRAALAETTVSPLWSSLIRLGAGLIFMVGLVAIRPQYLEAKSTGIQQAAKTTRERWQSVAIALKSPRLLGGVAIASFFATYLGIWLQQIALKYTAAGIAQALLATSPLFVLPVAALLGEKISRRAILGVAVALSGVWLLLYK
ncbi:DMT family transporter [cf. Phormidesmis sp. LEGE 11477]|uniref:DMT family transporter n=1 Tax=cf. Phormidesmis sp. LEGE 11477 TaxID=1828680 RepID=UPI00187F19E4|nr:DMT family transporter [cf. Phormidesmis sp. LEGE 11477]MBE9060962.1 DMT family transporter [cf. Phormidesmis sp. LEGE 11477]